MTTIPLNALDEKKERERRIIEAARRMSSHIPQGMLEPFEEPDWLIPSASIAIEVSELLPDRSAGTLFSGPQLSAFQTEVVAAAERKYYECGDVPPADVLIYFRNDWTRKSDLKAMAADLSEFVKSNYPSDEDTVVLEELSQDAKGWVDGASVIRISKGRAE